jgi:hypothetical protein
MADGGDNLFRAVELERRKIQHFPVATMAYVISQLNIRHVGREVYDWATSTDVKDGYIIVRLDSAQGLRIVEKFVDRSIVQEALAFLITFELLRQIKSSWLYGNRRKRTDLAARGVNRGVRSLGGSKVNVEVGRQDIVGVCCLREVIALE